MNALLKCLSLGTLVAVPLALSAANADAHPPVPYHHHPNVVTVYPVVAVRPVVAYYPPVAFQARAYIQNGGAWGGPVAYSTSCNGGPWSATALPDGGQATVVGTSVNHSAHIRIRFENGAGQWHTYRLNDGWSYHFARDLNGNLDLKAD